MKRLALLVALAACSGGSKSSPPLAPLPDDKPAPDAAVAVTPPPPVEEPEPPPMDPIELQLPGNAPTVKVTKAGKGKKAKLAYAFAAGTKQQTRVTLAIAQTQTPAGGKPFKMNVPSLVLDVDATIASVAADGTATYAAVVTAADALEVSDAAVSVADFKQHMMGTVVGMTLAGTVGTTGASGDITLRIEKPDASSIGILQMVELALPTWVVLPTEAVGPGAKWTASKTVKMQKGVVELTFTTDYELVSSKDGTWVVKGATKVTGADQTLGDGTISGIKGVGTTTSTIGPNTLYPAIENEVTISFTHAQSATDAVTIEYATKGMIGPAPTPVAPRP